MGDAFQGQFIYVFLVSGVDAILLAWLLLIWYRRSVRRLMRGRALVEATPPAPADSGAPVVPGAPPSLEPALVDSAAGPAANRGLLDPPQAGRLVLAYGTGAALHAAVITALKLVPEPAPLPLAAWVAGWWVNTWPIVPTLAAVLALDRRASLRLGLRYLVAGAVIVAGATLALQIVRGSFNTAPVTNVYWALAVLLVTATPPLLVLLVTGWRRVRAVTPLALATTLFFGFALIFSIEGLVRLFNVVPLRSTLLDVAAVTSWQAAYYSLFLLISLPVGALAWWSLRRLAGAFERKRFSDVQLVVDCWWVVVTAEVIATSLASVYGPAGIAGGVAAFAAYRTGVALVLRRRRPARDPDAKRLLLLRVFGHQARTESLFDRVAQRWRFHGPVQLIAGADLAMRTADPGDVLAFLSGRLADSYVRSAEDIPGRLGRLDLARDPDGRYRVNEVYCRDDTWRPTLEALLEVSDRVLMDLRSFDGRNAGCIFELKQLVRCGAGRTVVVCDRTTDLSLLERIVGEAREEAQRSGLTPTGDGRLTLVRMERQSPRELAFLVERLLGGGEPPLLGSAKQSPAVPA